MEQCFHEYFIYNLIIIEIVALAEFKVRNHNCSYAEIIELLELVQEYKPQHQEHMNFPALHVINVIAPIFNQLQPRKTEQQLYNKFNSLKSNDVNLRLGHQDHHSWLHTCVYTPLHTLRGHPSQQCMHPCLLWHVIKHTYSSSAAQLLQQDCR